jgi:ABC-type nitrate/sulfonate/bicarbonate transport system substrate-binding protein
MRIPTMALAVATGVAALGAGVAQSEPVRIRMAWVAPVSNWASIVLEKKELAEHLGQSYIFESIRFAGTPQIITAMVNGELEIANLAYSTLPLAVQNASMDDIRVIADEFQDGVEGRYTNQFHVLADGPIRKIEDLKGKVIGTNVSGGAVDIASRTMLRKHGLEPLRDYTIIESQFPTMRAMLADKKVDMGASAPPFSFDPELKRITRVLFTSRDAIGISQFIVWAARKSFIDKNRAAMVEFMEDMMIIERWFMDPKNHDEVMKIASKIAKQPPERFSWLFTKEDYYRSPDMLPNLDALQSNIDATYTLGLIKAPLDVRKYSDLSLAQEAAKRLK